MESCLSHVEICDFKISHTWIIHKFTSYNKPGQRLLSKCFSDDRNTNNKWQLSLFPCGECELQPYHDVSLFLFPVKAKQFPIITDCTVKIKTNDGKLLKIAEFINHKYTREAAHGFSTLIRQDVIRPSNEESVLDTDTFTLRCEITVKKLVTKPKINGLSDDLEYFFKRNVFTDITLTADNVEVKAHKVILASRSQVFEAMFSHNMMETTDGMVYIRDMSAAVLKEMVHYIYTGKLKNSKVGATELLIAADKYALDGLKAMCEESLSNDMSENNAATNLILADCYNASKLKASTISYITREARLVITTNEWKSLLETHPHLTSEILLAMDLSLNTSVTHPTNSHL